MTTRSFASTIASGWWIGLAVLLPIGALLVAVVLVEVGQMLFGLADLACAPCVSPNDGIDTAAAGGGLAGGGAAAGGAAAGGGSSRPPNPRFSDPAVNPRLRNPEDDVGDATSPFQRLENARDGAPFKRQPDTLLKVSRQLQKWTEYWVGTDIIGTVPAGGRA